MVAFHTALRLNRWWTPFGCTDGWLRTFRIPPGAREVRFHLERWNLRTHDIRTCLHLTPRLAVHGATQSFRWYWQRLDGLFLPVHPEVAALLPVPGLETRPWALWVDYVPPQKAA